MLQGLVLGHLGVRRPEVLVHAALGEDSAVVDFGEWSCVISTDPITGAADEAGWYAVHVACNDIGAMGAEPLGVLVTLLLPVSATEQDVARMMGDVDRAARELGVEVLGGHTEVTPGLTSPIISVTSVGRTPRGRVVTSAGARPGHSLVLAGAAGLEGTAILAADMEHRLRPHVADDVLERARGFKRLISVVRAGTLAARLGATALHDPTEGGVLGALWEMAEASGVGFRVWTEAVPVRQETREICAPFRADPLRLVSSGALLAAAPDGEALARGLEREGLVARVIGQVLPLWKGRWLVSREGEQEASPVDRDELWRILEEYS